MDVQGSWLASAMGIFFGWAFLAWVVRAWAKLRTHAWTSDDYTISGSVIAAFVHLVFVSSAIRHGYGQSFDSLSSSSITQIEIGLYVGQIFYIISFGLCRASAALFIAYISHSGPHIRPAQILAGVTMVWTAASLLVICIRGDISQPWTVLDGSVSMFIRWLAIEITGIIIEVWLWATATHLVWGIQMKLSRRIMIVCVFGARLLVIPFIATRLVYLNPRMNSGPTHSATISDLVTEACIHFSILAGSSTALKPLLTSFYAAYPPVNLTTSSSGLRSKDRATANDPYYPLETVKPAVISNNNSSKKVVIGRTGYSDITWQPYQGGSIAGGSSGRHHVSAYSKSGASHSAATSRTDSSHRKRDTLTGALTRGRNRDRAMHIPAASEDSGRMIIQMTTEVSVHANK